MNHSRWLKWGTAAMATGLACGAAMAQQARVISAVPVVQEVATPQQVCADEQVYSGQRTNGTGALIGALIGGVAGNALGHSGGRGGYGHRGYHGPSRGVTTTVGAVVGGLIGNQIEGTTAGTPAYQNMRRCSTETLYENRTAGYDVTYEYAGQRYTTRMDHNPGAWMPVQVQPQGTYSSAQRGNTVYAPAAGQFVGPSGVYTSAPNGTTVTQSITYEAPAVPVVVGVDAQPYYPPAAPWQRSAPTYWHGAQPPQPYWR